MAPRITAARSRASPTGGSGLRSGGVRLVALPAIFVVLWTPPSFLARTASRGVPLDRETATATRVERVEDPVVVLELNKPVERELLPGHTHAYHVPVEPAAYLRIAVEQWGPGLTLSLRDPEGQLRTDIPCRRDDPTPLSFIGELPGTYLLELRAQDAPADAGRYRLVLEAVSYTHLTLPTN